MTHVAAETGLVDLPLASILSGWHPDELVSLSEFRCPCCAGAVLRSVELDGVLLFHVGDLLTVAHVRPPALWDEETPW